MKKLVCLISTAAALAGLPVQATTLNEWDFFSDPVGKTLSQAVNSKGSATFASGGAGFLETDGQGALLCTFNDPGTTGMWTNGALLNAGTGNLTSGTFFLRYDLVYDLTATNNDSGTVSGFGFADATGTKVAGVALQYDIGATTNPAGVIVTELSDLGTNYSGKVSVIAKVDMATHKMAVWYDLAGSGNFAAETSPNVSNITVNLPDINWLRFQATGDFRPAGSTNFVKTGLLRMSDSFADAVAAERTVPTAKYTDEWTFERDLNGTPLSTAFNSGTNIPLAQFAGSTTNFQSTVHTTNRALRCTGEDVGSTGVWTNGAFLNAALTSTTSGVHYLRYDVAYNLSSPSNDSGTVLGVYFTGETGDKAAGVVMGYDKGNLTNGIPPGRSLVVIPGATDLTNNGTLTAIAEVNFDTGLLKVWYGLNGSALTNYAAPAVTTNLSLTSITNLRFQATGDFSPAGSSNNYADVDNIRHISSASAGGTAWTNITDPVVNIKAPPSLYITVTNSLPGGMAIGETNIVTVIISNSVGSGAATAVTSVLTNSGSSSAFTIVSNNSQVALAAGSSVTNTYQMTANEKGIYTVVVTAISAETNSAPYSFTLAAGANLSFILPPVITEVPGGIIPGKYEPGETLNITITSTNDGATTVLNATNTLSAGGLFTITPITSASYPSLAVGASTSTTYQVGISAAAPVGNYSFSMTNTDGISVWTNQFNLEVFIRQPNSDWVKANNTTNLNLGSSWVNGLVPNATDRAILTTNITSALINDLGADISWRGIALVSNTAAWTISSTNKLTLGSAGVDMSTAQANLTLASPLAIAATQTWDVAAARTLTASGPLTGSNSVELIKSGAGTLVVTNTANSYSGKTTISNGTLAVANANVLGTGLLGINGSTLATTADALLANSIGLTGSVTISNANSLTLSKPVSGAGSLTKTGAGLLILNATNTYSGGTTNFGTIEIANKDGLGSGRITMESGSKLQSQPTKFIVTGQGVPNAITLAGNATIGTKGTSVNDLINIDGPISGPGQLTTAGYQLVLNGVNTFSGGLVLNHSNSSWLRFNGPQSLGSGDITVISGLALANAGGTITNNIHITPNWRLNIFGNSVELSGAIDGVGALNLQDSTGTLTISGNNTNWSGSIINMQDTKTLRVGHPNALGTGTLTFGGDAGQFTIAFDTDISSGSGLMNNMTFANTFNGATGLESPVIFTINQNVVFAGTLADGTTVNTAGLMKNGPAKLTLNGNNTYSGPTKVSEGTLAGTGSVNWLTMAAGTTLDLIDGGMTFRGDLSLATNVITVLGVNNASSGLHGDGSSTLNASGTLTLDFSRNTSVTLNDTFSIFDNWLVRTDNGLSVQTTGLSSAFKLDTANLFIDGTVKVVASGTPPILQIHVTGMPGRIRIGDTNTVAIVISNTGGQAATATTSTLIHDGAAAAFSVTSNNAPVGLGVASSITNTYDLIANTNGSYVLTIQATSGEASSTATNLNVFVLSDTQVSYLTNGIAEISGGVISKKYEPGETIEITVTNINDGRFDVSNVTNSLSADPAYFTVTPTTPNVYTTLLVNRSASTTYRVVISNTTPTGNYTFIVTNQTGSMSWTDSFKLTVFHAGIPSASATALTIRVASGAIGTGTVALTNSGNASIGYTVTDDGMRPVANYLVSTQNEDRVVFLPAQFRPDSVFTNWTSSLDIGFEMPIFGAGYHTFSVSSNGALTLTSTNGTTATLNVFNNATAVDPGSVRFLKTTNQLVVAWGNGTGREFQAWLNLDGTVRYLYQYGAWGAGTIGLSNAKYNQSVDHTPGLTGRDSILLTPACWVTYAPTNGTVGAKSSQAITFTADATEQTAGTNKFDTIVNWENGSNSVIHVTVIVESTVQRLDILSTVPFDFYGPAGFITRTNMIVTNSGNVALNYTITDNGMRTATYTTTNVPHIWQTIPQAASYTLNSEQLGITSLDIGFPVVFFGNVYTALTVNANGTISLGNSQIISPFDATLSLDNNSSVRFLSDPGFSRFLVTWENVAQSGGGSDQTFQAILSRDGSVLFNYKQLASGWSNGVIRLSDTSGTTNGTLINASTTTMVTNVTPIYSNKVTKIGNLTFTNQVNIGETTNVVTTYTATANNQSLKFIPGKQRIISASPVSGNIAAGIATNIEIIGDARGLTGNGPNSVTNSTTLEFVYSTNTVSAAVNFIATNSADSAYPALAAEVIQSMWGVDPVISSQANIDGSRTISWAPATDGVSRSYKVWYTLDLMQSFQQLLDASGQPVEVVNGTSYLDTTHVGVPVIYYKVTVQ